MSTAATARPAPAPADLSRPLSPSALARHSEAELIAQVLEGPEPAAEVLRAGEQLAQLPFWQRRLLGVTGLVAEHGIPPRHAARLAALWELAERWFPDDRPTIASPHDALILLAGLGEDAVERVVLLMLDARHHLVGVETVAVGTLNASRLQPRDVLIPALRRGAGAIILAHSHPSGDARPSAADRRLTVALREAAELVCLPLLDHLVVARRTHYSFRRAEGWLSASGSGDDDGY